MASALSQAKKLAQYNNKLEKENVALQYSYNKSLAEQDRSWQEMMANSAHQREIKDLKAAGLNPVLSITGGNGATTPSGSSASVSKPSVDMSLPAKVMDMAMAQLNSATALQTTAMNNANSLQLAYDTHGYTMEQIGAEGKEDRKTKKATSGDTVIGQISNSPVLLKDFIKDVNKGMNSAFPKSKKASDDVLSLYNSYGKYIKEYEKQVKNGYKPTKKEKQYYKKYKRILTRVGYKVK